MKYKVLIARPSLTKRLKASHPNITIHYLDDQNQKYQAVSKIMDHYDGLLAVGHPVDKALMNKGKQLKIIANYGVGYDNIDIAFAKQKGIAISNTPNATTIVTANHTIGLILALLRKIVRTDRWIREKEIIPYWGHEMTLGTAISGSTLGIIGMGRIGQAVAKRALAFDMNILYHNRNRLPPNLEQSLQASYVNMEELLSSSNVISLHTPYTPFTHHLINQSAFAKMKKGTYLINTSRGAVIDEQAMITALEKGHLAGAALDVFEKEPEVPQALIEMEQVILTPHNGSGTHAARHEMYEEAMGNIIAFLTGKGEMSSRVV